MRIVAIILLACVIVELVRELKLLDRNWREYGEERARERGSTARWTDFNL